MAGKRFTLVCVTGLSLHLPLTVFIYGVTPLLDFSAHFPRVCEFVFGHSREVLSAPTDSSLSQVLNGRTRTMEDVLPLLKLWVARAQEPVKLKVCIEASCRHRWSFRCTKRSAAPIFFLERIK